MSKPMALWQKWAITSPLRLIKTCESHAKAFFCPHPAQEIYRLLRPYSVLHLIETHRVIFGVAVWLSSEIQWDPVIQLHGAPGRTPSLWTVRVLSLPLWQEQSWISAAEAQIAVLSADSFRDGILWQAAWRQMIQGSGSEFCKNRLGTAWIGFKYAEEAVL